MLKTNPKVNVACAHLSAEDNELIFRLIAQMSYSMCTVIAEVYQTTQPAHSMWNKHSVGALCFEKDYTKKSYFFRLYCLVRHQLVWEQEIYRHMNIALVRPFLLSFEGDIGMVALNFAYVNEANLMLDIVNPIVNKSRVEKQLSKVSTRGSTKNGQPRGRKLTKSLIGAPTNFQHIAHMGPTQKVTVTQVKYVNNATNNMSHQPRRAPPQPPNVQSQPTKIQSPISGVAPRPPHPISKPQTPASTFKNLNQGLPKQSQGGSNKTIPPPPPPIANIPKPLMDPQLLSSEKTALLVDPRNDLLKSIQKGTTLKPVTTRSANENTSVKTTDSNLMDQMKDAMLRRAKAIRDETPETSSESSDDEWDE